MARSWAIQPRLRALAERRIVQSNERRLPRTPLSGSPRVRPLRRPPCRLRSPGGLFRISAPRTHSILLDPVNPVAHPRAFDKGKKPQALPRMPHGLRGELMAENERRWHANPYCAPHRACEIFNT